MLTVYRAAFDGRPYLEQADFARTDEGDAACVAWFSARGGRDCDGGALEVLQVVGKPGDRLDVRQGGVVVAVVVVRS